MTGEDQTYVYGHLCVASFASYAMEWQRLGRLGGT